MVRVLTAFFPAVLLAYVLASISFTQTILAAVARMGLEVSMSMRMATTFDDLVGMATSYLLLILIAFILGLPVAAGLTRLLPKHRALLFTVAGFVAIVAMHVIMKAALGLSGIAATRTLLGLLAQGAAGAVGGYCYHLLSRPKQSS